MYEELRRGAKTVDSVKAATRSKYLRRLCDVLGLEITGVEKAKGDSDGSERSQKENGSEGVGG